MQYRLLAFSSRTTNLPPQFYNRRLLTTPYREIKQEPVAVSKINVFDLATGSDAKRLLALNLEVLC